MNNAESSISNRILRSGFVRFLGRLGQSRRFAFGLVAAALVSVTATYLAMTGTAPFRPDPRLILLLLNIDLVLVLLLATLVARKLVQIWVGIWTSFLASPPLPSDRQLSLSSAPPSASRVATQWPVPWSDRSGAALHPKPR